MWALGGLGGLEVQRFRGYGVWGVGFGLWGFMVEGWGAGRGVALPSLFLGLAWLSRESSLNQKHVRRSGSLNLLLTWPLHSLRGSLDRVPKSKQFLLTAWSCNGGTKGAKPSPAQPSQAFVPSQVQPPTQAQLHQKPSRTETWNRNTCHRANCRSPKPETR